MPPFNMAIYIAFRAKEQKVGAGDLVVEYSGYSIGKPVVGKGGVQTVFGFWVGWGCKISFQMLP